MTNNLRQWAAMAVFMALPAMAQDEASAPKVDVSFNTRAEFSSEFPKQGKNSAGFHGSYLNLMIKGELTKGLSYSFRQRLNKFPKLGDNWTNDMFSATDWIYLTYKPTQNWAFSGGKQIVAVGGWEYDAAPIDIYYSSLFWQNIACYQFGVSSTYTTDDGCHGLTLQFCNSPYKLPGQTCFAYNLVWNGQVGVWHPLWSVNVMEYERGHFVEYYMLGNRFNLGALTLDVDLLNRQYEDTKFMKNWSLICKADYRITPRLNVFAKGGYDRFEDDALTAVEAKKPFGSAGVEFLPIKKYPGVRLHAVWGMTTYTGQTQQNFMLGATWNCNVYKK